MTGGRGGLFYGWVVVGVSFASQFATTGFVFYSFAVVLTPLADEFSGGDRTPIIGLQIAMAVAGVVIMPIIGRLVGRGWIRALMTGGLSVIGLGLIGIAHADALWQLALIYATLISVGGGMSDLPAATVVVNWFERRRATALGASQLGASFGGVVMAPVVALLVEAHGWRGAFELLGVALLCLAPLVWALVVNRPEDRGLRPDGDPASEQPSEEASRESPPFSTREALREPNLWLIALSTGIAFMATTALLSHVVAFGTDAGFSASRAALLASLIAGGAALGKLVFGWLCDRIGASRAFTVSLLGQALGFATLTQVESYAFTAGVLFLTGVALGGTYPLSSALLASAFGRESFGPMLGLMWPIMMPPQLVGPILAAWVFDRSGSYHPAFWLFVGALVIAVFLVRAVRLGETAPRPAAVNPQ